MNDNGIILAGHLLYLLDGTYSGTWTSAISGTSDNPIIVMPYPGMQPIIDGQLTINGHDTTWRDGIIFTYSGWSTRQSAFDSLTPADMPYDRVLRIYGPRTKVINCLMHDLAEGELWEAATDSLIYGCVMWNNGFLQATAGGVGHCLYTQNNTGTMTIHNNVFVSAYNLGMHAYGSALAHLDNYDVRRNIHMAVRFLIGGLGVVEPAGIVVTDNAFYRSRVQLGYTEDLAIDVTIRDNYIADELLQVGPHTSIDVQGNTIAYASGVVNYIQGASPPAGAWDANAYATTEPQPFDNVGQAGKKSFAGWKTLTGWDAASTFTAALPTTNVVKIYVNSYRGAHLGTVAIYNWEGLASVSVDLSSLGLTIDQSYKLRNAQNYLAEWQAFTYDGNPVSVLMTGWTIAVPTAAGAALYASTFPTFGAFVVTP